MSTLGRIVVLVLVLFLAGCEVSLLKIDLVPDSQHDPAPERVAEQDPPPAESTGPGVQGLTPTERAIAEALGAQVHGE